MALQESLSADLKAAMLNRDAKTVSVLRMLSAAIKQVEIDTRKELSDDERVAIVRKEVKKRDEAAATYSALNEVERASDETWEANVLKKYLPAAANPDEVRAFLQETARGLAPLEPRHKGELIRTAMQKFGSAVDGKTVSEIVNSLF
jgi:uncharacterized protein